MEYKMSALPAKICALLLITNALMISPVRGEDTATASVELAKQHFSFAVQNKISGNLEEAIAQYEKSLSYDKSIFQVHYSYADLLLEMGKKEQARRHYLASYDLNPDHYNSVAMLSRLYYETALYDSSLIMYERMYELAPEHTEFLRSIAQLRTFLGDKNRALDAWDKLFDTDDGTLDDILTAARLAHDIPDTLKTIAYAEMALKKDPGNNEALTIAAKSQFSRGEMRQSAGYYRRLAEQDSTNISVMLQLEQLYRDLNNRTGLAWTLERHVIATPGNVAVIGELATILAEDGQVNRSLEYIHKGLQIKPNDGRLRILLGEYYRAADQKEKALTEFRTALNDPKWASSAKHLIMLIEQPETAEEQAEREFFRRGAQGEDEKL